MGYQDFPVIKSWPSEVYNHENREIYNVGMAVEMILANPQEFQFGMVHFRNFLHQLEGRGSYDAFKLNMMSDENKKRPVLFAKEAGGDNAPARLIDGYHRAMRCYRDEMEGVAAWILTREQTLKIIVDLPHVPAAMRV